MKRYVLIISLAWALVACGGGDNVSDVPHKAEEVLEAGEKKASGVSPNDLPGEPATRSVGSLHNGGHVVAWVFGLDAYLQRFNKAGKRLGDATKLPIPNDPPIEAYPQHPAIPPVVLVQANGEVVVVYHRVRAATALNPAHPEPYQQHVGVYLQRFAASGARIQGELEIASMLRFVPGARLELAEIRTLALSDGSFAVSWGVAYRGGLGANQVDYFMRRFDGSGKPVSDILVPVKNYWCANRHLNSTFEWVADEVGGFWIAGTIYPRQFDGEDTCGGYGPPVERQVNTYYPGAVVPDASRQERRKACLANARGFKGQDRKKLMDGCLVK